MITIPSAAFRKNSINETFDEYRLYAKGELDRKFCWMGAYNTKEEAQNAALKMPKKCYQHYVIKKVTVHYEEEICEQSAVLEIVDRIPELKGIL